jgi:hypothetical protein
VNPRLRGIHMPSRKLVVLALAIGLSLGLIILISEQAVRNYPSADGISLSTGQLLGGDFVAFYIGGRLFDSDRGRLYDLEYQREFRTELFGPAAKSMSIGGELPFVYPPLVAALICPFSRLPFQRAFLLWTLFGLTATVSSLILLMRSSGASEVLPTPLLLLFCFAFLPFSMNTLLGGQISWLGVAILAIMSTAILRERDYLAGLVMSLSYYKPPLFLLLLIVLSLAKGRRFILGFLSGATLLVGGTFLLVGADGVLSFLTTASRYVYGQEILPGVELPPAQGMGLVGLSVSLFSSMTITLAVLALPFLGLVWVGLRLEKAQEDSNRLFGIILCITASLAFSAQIIKYDLALLMVPMLLGVAWCGAGQNPKKTIILLPLFGFYFEFPFRQTSIGGSVFNASSFLFVVLLGLLTWQGWHLLKSKRVDVPSQEPTLSTEQGR